MPSILLIPAYQPGAELPRLIRDVTGPAFRDVIVVDDGSGPEYAHVFAACHATVLLHKSNQGKGAALKTGMNHVAAKYPGCGVVTADADGQHTADDILRVAGRLEQSLDNLVLGARQFAKDTPARSWIGNYAAQLFVHALMGRRITDTQTGLRGIPAKLLGFLASMSPDGYEFELEMLNVAKHFSVPIVEEPIRAIYEPGNPTSHFRPFRDSFRIGFVLARFGLLSLATALLDGLVFFFGMQTGMAISSAQLTARAAAVLFNYPMARRSVFYSGQPHRKTLPRYLLLVAVSGYASYRLLSLLHDTLGWPVLISKVGAESILFLINFLVQRDLIFTRKSPHAHMDVGRTSTAPRADHQVAGKP